MSARYVSSQFIKNIQKGKKRIAVEHVDQTTAWKRPTGFPSASTKEVFSDVVDKNSDSFKPETVKVAMKESQHQSDKDKRMHYTAVWNARIPFGVISHPAEVLPLSEMQNLHRCPSPIARQNNEHMKPQNRPRLLE
ncbi:hypothetical protein N7G274_003723 [Stereocaulon virgatum]|uniref:Uncharacterized protein n=1 Tax=Stereocaulon virgatum TaxID=373712 RepID=A0ABR4AC38_9LECA